MRPSSRSLLILIAFLASVAAAPLQGGTPPPPQPTPTPSSSLLVTCLDDGLGKCLEQFLQRGWWGILIAVLILVAILFWRVPYVQGLLVEGWKKRGEKKYEEIVAKEEVKEATRHYLEKAIEDYKIFTLRGVGERAKEIEPPQLDQAYVSLRILPESRGDLEPFQRGVKDKSVELTNGEGEFGRRLNKTEPMELPDVFAYAPRLAIIGVAGSGKTTLLQWIGLAMARAMLQLDDDLKDDQKRIIEKVDNPLLPVLIPLREFNRYCLEKKQDRTAQTLLEYLPIYIGGRHPTLNLPPVFFTKQLKQGTLLMFDGIDEVAKNDRPAIRAAIEQLLRDLQDSPTRCLVTSRSYAYFGSAQLAEGFVKAEVQSLTSEQRAALLRNWYRAIFPKDADRATSAANDLIRRIETADPRVQDISRTPLMATIFALVHQEGGELPRQRAELYEKCVNFLLTEPHHKEDEAGRSLQDWGGMDPGKRLSRLSFIALRTQALGQRGDAILEDDLVELFWPQFRQAVDENSARGEARAFLRLVADRGGLLEEQDGRYGFYTHRTFREYLAGRYLVEEMNPNERRKFLSDQLPDDSWDESVRLAAGFLSINSELRPNEYLKQLAELGDGIKLQGRALRWAMFALADLTPEKKGDDRVYPEIRQLLTTRSKATLEANPPELSIGLRYSIGLALGLAGDPRLNPLNPPTVPVPAGPFRMGTSPEDEKRFDEQGTRSWKDEKPAHLVELPAFEIGIYPVTNMEFRLFYEEKGYDQQDKWSPDGWRWRTDARKSDLSIYPVDSQKALREWLEGRPVEKRNRPLFWDDPEWNAPNLPVVGVSWFEAEAYCNWLSAKTGRRFRLPSEAQWEKAARGAEGRLWPWGDEWDASKCNNDEAEDKIGRTSTAGIYPNGASPYGALDMAGNVWEWCQDWYAEDEYERRAAAAVSNPPGPETGTARVVRGGSWGSDRGFARCASRYRFDPDYFHGNLGFRLVVCPNDHLNS